MPMKKLSSYLLHKRNVSKIKVDGFYTVSMLSKIELRAERQERELSRALCSLSLERAR
jgi:hypothetical protein